jgi:hypothetical protein
MVLNKITTEKLKVSFSPRLPIQSDSLLKADNFWCHPQDSSAKANHLPESLRLHIVGPNQNEGEMNSQNKIDNNAIRIKHQ